jgi:hypothetical protein
LSHFCPFYLAHGFACREPCAPLREACTPLKSRVPLRQPFTPPPHRAHPNAYNVMAKDPTWSDVAGTVDKVTPILPCQRSTCRWPLSNGHEPYRTCQTDGRTDMSVRLSPWQPWVKELEHWLRFFQSCITILLVINNLWYHWKSCHSHNTS